MPKTFEFLVQMEYASDQEKVLDDEGGWVDTHHFAEKGVEEKISEMNLEEAASSSPGVESYKTYFIPLSLPLRMSNLQVFVLGTLTDGDIRIASFVKQ